MDTTDMLHRPRFTRSGEPIAYPDGHDYGWQRNDRSLDANPWLGASIEAAPLMTGDEVTEFGRHETERIIKQITTLRRMGRREWTQTVEVEVYRSSIPTLDDFALWLSTFGRQFTGGHR